MLQSDSTVSAEESSMSSEDHVLTYVESLHDSIEARLGFLEQQVASKCSVVLFFANELFAVDFLILNFCACASVSVHVHVPCMYFLCALYQS